MKIATALLFSGMLLAQSNSGGAFPNFPTVRAQGHARVSAKPDQVRIDIGVVTQGKTAAAAAAANATQLTEVMAALKKAVGSQGEIQTLSYQVHPDYRHPREGGTPSIAGYTATNVVRVTTSKIDDIGQIIDAASAKGANTIRGIHFGVKDERELRAQALREAVRDARTNAEAMAAGLGLKIVRVVRIEDSGGPPVVPLQRYDMMMARAEAAPPTPVAPGTIDVEATAVVTAELSK
jgi:uncharacterized protein YggE